MNRPNTRTPTRPQKQEEMLITLRALAGLVTDALARAAACDDEHALAAASAELTFWRDFQLHHTRRLLPAVVGDADESACRAFTAQLVRDVYREDGEASSDHGRVSAAAALRRPVAPQTGVPLKRRR